MSKIFIKAVFLLLTVFLCGTAECAEEVTNNTMVKREEFLGDNLNVVGLPDFFPFSWYEDEDAGGGEKFSIRLHNVFWQPLQNALKHYTLNMNKMSFPSLKDCDYTSIIIGMREGNFQLMLGVYSDTKQFSGIVPIYPAVISNPIHIMGLAETQDKIKDIEDLKKLKGVVCECEYLSDFAWRKMKDLNLEHVKTPYEAYEKIFTGNADYLIGSLYYNRIMSSRYGLERYLSSSKKPLFKIPVFMAMSKLTPKLSEYVNMFQKISSNPQFAIDIKNEILRVVETEVQKNAGIVPPSFAREQQEKEQQEEAVEEEKVEIKGRVVEQQQEQKTIDEVLEGI